MRTRTLKLEGTIQNRAEYTFEYPFGAIEPITNGRWELALSSVSAIFSKDLSWNTIFEVSTNYIEKVVVRNDVRERQEMPLAFIRFKGQPSEKIMLGFRWRDFFEVTTPTRTFTLTFKEHQDPDIPVPPPPAGKERRAFVSILLLFRRIE